MTDKDFVKTLIGEIMTTYDAESIIKGIEMLEAENASLRERLERAVELPFFQKDGEYIIIIYKEEHGMVCAEEYFEDEYYDGMRGSEAAEARFAELKEEKY